MEKEESMCDLVSELGKWPGINNQFMPEELQGEEVENFRFSWVYRCGMICHLPCRSVAVDEMQDLCGWTPEETLAKIEREQRRRQSALRVVRASATARPEILVWHNPSFNP